MSKFRLAGTTAVALVLTAVVATSAVVAQQTGQGSPPGATQAAPGRPTGPATPPAAARSGGEDAGMFEDDSDDDLTGFLDTAESTEDSSTADRGYSDETTGQATEEEDEYEDEDVPGRYRGYRGGMMDERPGMLGPRGRMLRERLMERRRMMDEERAGMMGPRRGMMGERFGMMGPRAGMMGRRGFFGVCGPRGGRVAEFMLLRLERVTQPTDAQRQGFERLKDAVTKGVELARAGCPSEPSFTLGGRLAAIEKRLDGMLQAVRTVRPAFDAYIASLSEEQRARLYAAHARAVERRRMLLLRRLGEERGWRRGGHYHDHHDDRRGGDGWPGAWRGRS